MAHHMNKNINNNHVKKGLQNYLFFHIEMALFERIVPHSFDIADAKCQNFFLQLDKVISACTNFNHGGWTAAYQNQLRRVELAVKRKDVGMLDVMINSKPRMKNEPFKVINEFVTSIDNILRNTYFKRDDFHFFILLYAKFITRRENEPCSPFELYQKGKSLLSKIDSFDINQEPSDKFEDLVREICIAFPQNRYHPFEVSSYQSEDFFGGKHKYSLYLNEIQNMSEKDFLKKMKILWQLENEPKSLIRSESEAFSKWFNQHHFFMKYRSGLSIKLLSIELAENYAKKALTVKALADKISSQTPPDSFLVRYELESEYEKDSVKFVTNLSNKALAIKKTFQFDKRIEHQLKPKTVVEALWHYEKSFDTANPDNQKIQRVTERMFHFFPVNSLKNSILRTTL